MRFWLSILVLLTATSALADVSVTATVDHRDVAFGESFLYTITINGSQSGQPSITPVDGLSFAGPSTQSNMSFVNGTMSRSVSFAYQVTPTHTGSFSIPANSVTVNGKKYSTEAIQIVVGKGAVATDLQKTLFGRISLNSSQVYLGQNAPLDLFLFAQQRLPVKGLSQFQAEADGLGYKYLNNVQTGKQTINGEAFTVFRVSGVISPTKLGKLVFGPCVIKVQMAIEKNGSERGRFENSLFDQFFGRTEIREVPVTIDPVPIEVLPLPEDGKPADFNGAVGQWKLEVTAKPTEVSVGDPITLTIKISGDGNIDTVPTPSLRGLEGFKTYDPTTKTTKNELATQGERIFEQVLVPKSVDAKQLPEVRLAYFDPVAKSYKVSRQAPIPLRVRAGSGGRSAIVSGSVRSLPTEKLGQDIVYLKGDLGSAAATTPFYSTVLFWLLNLMPAVVLASAVVWKQRTDRLQGDVAYARRIRAAKNARKLLAAAATFDDLQRVLQSYLGDRLNIPSFAITVSAADEQRLPSAVVAKIRELFEACDAARFAGQQVDLPRLKQTLEQVIDELENITL